MREIVSHRTQLASLSTARYGVHRTLENVLAPWFDGRIPAGDIRSPDLKAAVADLFVAADRVDAQAKADLEQLEIGEVRS